MAHSDKEEELARRYLESTTPDRALPYLIKVADKARRRSANDTAIKYYRQAMTLLPKRLNGQRKNFFDVRLGLSKALKFKAEYLEAQTILLDALQQLKNWKAGTNFSFYTPTFVETLRELADVRQREGAFDVAMNYLDLSLDHLDKTTHRESSVLRRRIMERICWIQFRQGDLKKAYATAKSSLTGESAEEEPGDPITHASLYNTLGGICWQQGDLDKAIAHIELSLKLNTDSNNLRGMGVAQTNLGVLHDIKGDWSKAIEYYERAYTVQKKIGDLDNQALSLYNLGTLRMALGDHDGTRRDVQTALSIQEQLGENFGVAHSRANLAQIDLFEKRFDDAARHAEESLKMAQKIGGKEIEVYARWILAMVQAETGDLTKGLDTAMYAWHMARVGGFHDENIDCMRTVGLLLARRGKYSEAEQSLQGSLDLSRKQKDPYRQGLALLELGRVFLNHLEDEESESSQLREKAVKSFREAISIFKSLGSGHNLLQAEEDLGKC